MGNKENGSKPVSAAAQGIQISMILENSTAKVGEQIRGLVIIKLDRVDWIANLNEIVLNLVGFERFKFVR